MAAKIKERYIAGEFYVNFLFSFLLFSFLFSIEGVFRALGYMASGAFYPFAIISIFFITFIAAFQYIIPLTFLYGMTALFSRLSADRELIIFSTAGIRPVKILQGLFRATLLTTLFLLFCNLYIIPEANLKRRSMLNLLRLREPLALLQEKTMVRDIPGITIYIEKITENYELSNIAITQEAEGRVNFLKAESGEASHRPGDNLFVFDLENGSIITHLSGDRIATLNFSEYQFTVKLPDRLSPGAIRTRITEVPTGELMLSGSIEDRMEIHRRILFASTPFIFLLLGSGIGMKLRQKSRMLHIGLGGFISLFFLQLTALGEVLSRRAGTPLFIWTPFLVLAISGMIIWRRGR